MPLRYYRSIVDTCQPYIIARLSARPELIRTPLGIPIPEANVFDPQKVSSGPFLNLVKRLDGLAYGPLDLTMPSWVFYDCAVMPGAVFGFAKYAGDLPAWVRRSLDVPTDYDGLVPMSLFITIPMASRKATLVYSLASVNQVAPGAAPEGLWRVTLATGTAALGISSLVGATQWRSPRLGLYAGLGPLELITAWTPAHDNPATVTFRVATDEASQLRLLRGDLIGAEGIDQYLDADDTAAMEALQAHIERGVQVSVVGPAEIRGSETRLPIQFRDPNEVFESSRGAGFVRRFQG